MGSMPPCNPVMACSNMLPHKVDIWGKGKEEFWSCLQNHGNKRNPSYIKKTAYKNEEYTDNFEIAMWIVIKSKYWDHQ